MGAGVRGFVGILLVVAAVSGARTAPAAEDAFAADAWIPPPSRRCFACRHADARRRGPVELRDEWILAQPRLTLPAASPDPLILGETRLHLTFNMGSDFGFRSVSKASGFVRGFLVDGEHRTVAIAARHGIRPDLDVGIRVPVHWRGAGFLDDIIDPFHAATSFITLDNDRDDFGTNEFRVIGHDDDAFAFHRIEDVGTGLGSVELSAQWGFLPPRPGCWAGALIGRVSLPTGTGPFRRRGVDLGVQAVFAKTIARGWDVYGGVGGTWFAHDEFEGFRYVPLRGHAFAALEWQVVPSASVFVQTDFATRLIDNVESYPAEQMYLHFAAKADLSRCWTIEAGFTENLFDQQSTVDFSIFIGLTARL
jgi:hypothetical protein